MKRVMYDTMVIAMLIVIIGSATIARVLQNKYTREGIVIAANALTEEVIILDTTDNEWVFYEVGYTEGDTVLMIMDTHNTDDIITDDIIKHVEIIYK